MFPQHRHDLCHHAVSSQASSATKSMKNLEALVQAIANAFWGEIWSYGLAKL